MLALLFMARRYFRLVGNERGATAVEYGLIVALIAAVIITVVGFLGTDVFGAFDTVEDKIDKVDDGD